MSSRSPSYVRSGEVLSFSHCPKMALLILCANLNRSGFTVKPVVIVLLRTATLLSSCDKRPNYCDSNNSETQNCRKAPLHCLQNTGHTVDIESTIRLLTCMCDLSHVAWKGKHQANKHLEDAKPVGLASRRRVPKF